ncbi:MAG: DegV family protein [Bacillota bacterium]
MKIKQLDGKKFFAAFKHGAHYVEENKNHLNSINLFPVPDNDTGNNMSLTLTTTVLKVQPHSSFYKTIRAIANNSIQAAHGNSGLILAQFFSGFYNKMKNKEYLTTTDFAESVKKIVPYIYENIENPQEGTMITVIKDWAERLPELAQNIDDFTLLFESSIKTAKKSLINTKNQLEVLKNNKTVDAGAQGFVYFLEGISNYWQNSKQHDTSEQITTFQTKTPASRENDFKHIALDDLSYRYCTEVLMVSDISTARVKSLIKNKGDSLIAVSSGSKLRVHIHTDEPEEIIHLLRDKGKIIEQKADDMQRQIESIHHPLSNTALVTDSIADIPQNLLDKYQIHQIPLNILIDGVNYLDKKTISTEYFFEYLNETEEFPSSSQPNTEFIYQYLLNLADAYDSILIISVADEQSGTGQAFRKAKSRVEKIKDIEISCIDSRLNSGAQGLLVLKAAEEIARGQKLPALEQTVKNYRDKTEIYVNVNNFDYMVRGGRINSVMGYLANLFNLKPIISLDKQGKGTISGKSISRRGVKRKINKLAEKMKQQKGIEKYAVVHAQAPELAAEMADNIKSISGQEPEYIMQISSIVALNAGPGAVALCLMAD